MRFLIKFLDLGADVHATDQDGNTALHVAARYGHELLINTLLQHEADILKYGLHRLKIHYQNYLTCVFVL